MGENREYIMEEERLLEERFGRDDRRRVPEGYFHVMADEVMRKLPDQPQQQKYVEMTRWQKLKPYVYLAAMFLGVWLMMNVMGRFMTQPEVSLDNPPEHIAMMMSTDASHEATYVPEALVNEMQLEDEVSSEFTDMHDFTLAFREAGEQTDASAYDEDWL